MLSKLKARVSSLTYTQKAVYGSFIFLSIYTTSLFAFASTLVPPGSTLDPSGGPGSYAVVPPIVYGGTVTTGHNNEILYNDGSGLLVSDSLFTRDTTTHTTSLSDNLAVLNYPVFTGSGLDDVGFGGSFSGTVGAVYTITIDSVGGTDTFSWSCSTGGGATGVLITGGSPQILNNGVGLQFSASSGHTLNDSWSVSTIPINATFSIFQDSPYNVSGIGTVYQDTTNNVQAINIFGNINGSPTGAIYGIQSNGGSSHGGINIGYDGTNMDSRFQAANNLNNFELSLDTISGLSYNFNGSYYTFPSSVGSAGQVLTTDGVNTLSWQTPSGGSGWGLTGNAGTTVGTNFIGTTDAQDLMFKVNNVPAGYLTISGGTAYGYNSGVNDVGSGNSFFGQQSGTANTIGDGNSFFGFQSGNNNINGVRNTFSGYQSGRDNTSGYFNTFTGHSAGQLNTIGNNNTFIGLQAGQGNTSGNFNTFTGVNTGINNGSGSRNVFTGYQSGSNNTGDENAFFGYQSGYSNNSGGDNTFIGPYAGFSNVSGNDNSFFGRAAGYNSTGSRNISIGYQSDITGGADDSIALGTNASAAAGQFAISDTITSLYFKLNSGSNGDVLTTDGSGNASWSLPTTGAGGANTQIQFNNTGILDGTSELTWDGSSVGISGTDGLYVTSSLTPSNLHLNVAFGYAPEIQLYDSGNRRALFGYDGNLGRVAIHNDTYDGGLYIYNGDGITLGTNQGTYAGNALYVEQQNNQVYTPIGIKLGVGTNSPTHNLEVIGQFADAAPFVGYFDSGWLSTRLAINNNSGNTGFGLLIGDTLKFSVAVAQYIDTDLGAPPAGNYDYVIYNDQLGNKSLQIDGDNNFLMINAPNGQIPDYQFDVRANSATSYAAGFTNEGSDDNRYGIVIKAGADAPVAAKWIQFDSGNGTDEGSICYTGGQANICAPSDIRLKENIIDTTLGLDNLMAIKVHDFSYLSDPNHFTVHGFVAQELYNAYPNAVFKPSNPDEYWKVSYNQLTPLIVKSIQDLSLKIKPLEDLMSADNTFAEVLRKFFENPMNSIRTFIADNIKARTQICIDDVCIDKTQLRNVINSQNNNYSNGGGNNSPTPDPTPIPDPTPDIIPTPDPTPAPDPSPTDQLPQPEADQPPAEDPIPDVTPTPDPAPTPDPTPDVTPTPDTNSGDGSSTTGV